VNRFLREFRLIPIVLFAMVSLLALKIGGLLVSGGYILPRPRPAQADDIRSRPLAVKRSSAQQAIDSPEITGAVDKPPPEKDANAPARGDAVKQAAAQPATGQPAASQPAPSPQPDGAPTGPETARPISPAERAVLERLQERRQELDRRARELDVREGLLAAAEQRIDARLAEIKEVEARINAAMGKKDEAEAARLKGLVTVYENMRPREAARIFDRLDLKILVDIASLINPRRMADIMAQMSSEAAGRLTVELAARSISAERAPSASDLPKIEGRPGG